MSFSSKINNQQGSTLIGAVIVMLTLAYLGASMVQMNSGEISAGTNEIESSKAFYVAQAGVEATFSKLKNGQSADGVMQFDNGTATVTTNPGNGTFTVVGVKGAATKTMSIVVDPSNAQTPIGFSSDCMALDTSGAYISGRNLKGVKLIKTCNTSATLTEVEVSWNVNSCAVDSLAAQDDSAPEEGQITICHVPPGNPGNAHTIVVDQSGWINGHKSGTGTHHNMDYLGECTGEAVAAADCDTDTGAYQLQKIYLDDLSGGQTVADQLFTGAKDSAQVTDVTDRIFTENTTYNFGVSTSDDAFYFSSALPSEGVFTILTRFADNSTLQSTFTAYDPGEDAYAVSNGTVTVNGTADVKLDVLGSAITCGSGGSAIPVYVDFGRNGTYSELFHGHRVSAGDTYTYANTVDNTAYTIRGRGVMNSCSRFNVSYTSTSTTQVKTLVNGDAAPALAGYGGQQSVQSFLANYLDGSGHVVLDSNQVIMLFELGTNLSTSPNSLAADFQDIVVLLTIQ